MKHPTPRAFTLIELLVVIGIITLLLGMLLPMLTHTRRAADTTKCLAQLHEIGLLFSTYADDYDHVFPPATMTNSKDSPYSPHGLEFWKQPMFHPWVGKPILPDDTPPTPKDHWIAPPWDARWSTDPMKGASVMAPIGWYFMRSAGDRPGIWMCPAQDQTTADAFRTNDFVQHASDPADTTLQGAYLGYKTEDEWKPGYMYMATHEFQFFINAHPDVAEHYHMRDLIVRNIAGLSLSQCRPRGNGNESTVVTFTDYSPRFHSRPGQPDLYDLKPGQRGIYQANFLFLDNHVETRPFHDFDSYLAQFHRGINQTQHNVNYAQTYAPEMNKIPTP